MAQSRRPDGEWDLWRVGVGLRPWRVVGGEIQPGNLPVIKHTRLPFWVWRLIFWPGSIVEFAVEPEAIAEGRGKWKWFLGWKRDPELREVRSSWRRKKVLEDPEYGSFAYDERLDLFTSTASWLGQPIRLFLGTGFGDKPPALGKAKEILADAVSWDARAKSAIIDELLKLKNEGWLADNEEPFTAEQFLARIKPDTLSVESDGYVQIDFDDGDLFWGHMITASFDPQSDEVSVDISG